MTSGQYEDSALRNDRLSLSRRDNLQQYTSLQAKINLPKGLIMRRVSLLQIFWTQLFHLLVVKFFIA